MQRLTKSPLFSRLHSLIFASAVTIGSWTASAQESDLAALRAAPATDATAQLRLGRALRRAGHFDEAVRALRVAARGPTRAEALFETARVRFDQNDFRAARSVCNTVPAGAMRSVCLARAHLVWQRAALAVTEINRARALDPNNAELKLVVADAARISGRLQEAEAGYRDAATALPNRAEPHIGLGIIFETAGRLDDARTAFQHAVDADTHDPVAALYLGKLLKKQRNFDAALPLLQRANSDRPGWAEALVALGDVLLARNALPEALTALQRATEIDPNQPGAQSALGRVHLRAGRLVEAAAPLRAAIQQVANDAEARVAYAELLGRTEQGRESLDEWNRAIDLLPTDPMPRMRAAQQAISMRESTLASAYLERILADNPQHSGALLMRADIAFENNDRRSARQLYQQALAGRGEFDRAHATARIQEIDAPPRQRRR